MLHNLGAYMHAQLVNQSGTTAVALRLLFASSPTVLASFAPVPCERFLCSERLRLAEQKRDKSLAGKELRGGANCKGRKKQQPIVSASVYVVCPLALPLPVYDRATRRGYVRPNRRSRMMAAVGSGSSTRIDLVRDKHRPAACADDITSPCSSLDKGELQTRRSQLGRVNM